MQANTHTTSLPFKRSRLAQGIGALLIAAALAFAPHADARVYVSVNIAPPLLPIYSQPPIPAPGYYWVPGYWAWDEYYGYYWVPGCWVRPPYAGALWTPGYWAWEDGAYGYYPGYWGLTVGYYGGIDYGFGYGGIGYYGGYWRSNNFFYNKTVNNITINNITNVYTGSPPAGAVVTTSRASFTGPNGVNHLPTQTELANSRQAHTDAVAAQVRQQTLASHQSSQRVAANHGVPPIAATTRAGVMERANATAATGSSEANHREMSARTSAGTTRSTGFVSHRESMRSPTRTASPNERATGRTERGSSSFVHAPSTGHRDTILRTAHESRTTPTRAPHEHVQGRMERDRTAFVHAPSTAHREATLGTVHESRSMTMAPRAPSESRPIVHHRESTAFSGEGMRSQPMPMMRPETRTSRNSVPREMATTRYSEGPRAGAGMRAAPVAPMQRSAPRGGERQPAAERPKDHDRHGG